MLTNFILSFLYKEYNNIKNYRKLSRFDIISNTHRNTYILFERFETIVQELFA